MNDLNWAIHQTKITTHKLFSYFFPFVKQNHSARVLACEAVPNTPPNLSLSVIEGGGSRFLPIFLKNTCMCNAVTICWVLAGPSLNMEAAPVHFL